MKTNVKSLDTIKYIYDFLQFKHVYIYISIFAHSLCKNEGIMCDNHS